MSQFGYVYCIACESDQAGVQWFGNEYRFYCGRCNERWYGKTYAEMVQRIDWRQTSIIDMRMFEEAVRQYVRI